MKKLIEWMNNILNIWNILFKKNEYDEDYMTEADYQTWGRL